MHDPSKILHITENFYYIAGGLGLLFAGIGGLRYIFKWINETKENNRINKEISILKNKYPVKEFNEEFPTLRLIKISGKTRVYIHDLDEEKRHHITTYPLYERLGFNLVKKTHYITESEMNDITKGDPIAVKGLQTF